MLKIILLMQKKSFLSWRFPRSCHLLYWHWWKWFPISNLVKVNALNCILFWLISRPRNRSRHAIILEAYYVCSLYPYLFKWYFTEAQIFIIFVFIHHKSFSVVTVAKWSTPSGVILVPILFLLFYQSAYSIARTACKKP